MTTRSQEEIRDKVREGYAKIAESGVWLGQQMKDSPEAKPSGCCGGGCCGPTTVGVDDLATRIGYDAAELQAIPEGANMGLSCGNPTAIASLKAGEVVLDLGSGGGFDVFLAAPRVGPSGRAIGVDMTAQMISKARRNAEGFTAQSGLDNVEFRLGEIEHLPVADASVDVVISNCVINLSTDKPAVWREVARVLKPGGRVAVSDLALHKPLPVGVAEMIEAYVGCIAGASLVADVERHARAAGLTDVSLEAKAGYIDALTGMNDPLYAAILEKLPPGAKVSDYVTSLDITARKPA